VKAIFRQLRFWSHAVPLGLAAVLVIAGLGVVVRGTWAARVAVDPVSVAEGPVCQLVEDGDRGIVARCAVRLPHPPDEVWAAITDYENYGDICPYVHAGQIDYDPAGPTRIDACAASGLGWSVPFTAQMRFEQNLDEYASSWDEPPQGDVLVNRGRWIVLPVGARETLLSLHMEVQVRGVPDFLMRQLSLHRVEAVVRGVERRLTEPRPQGSGEPGKKW
jgi:hypothetical protein